MGRFERLDFTHSGFRPYSEEKVFISSGGVGPSKEGRKRIETRESPYKNCFSFQLEA
jgi:hypothetical protein